MEQSVVDHCRELERCNQRGGRMLSIFDLLRAQSLPLELAAWLMSHISRGSSFLVGASPGGAGKTTVMCALANLVPPGTVLVPATEWVVAELTEQRPNQAVCVICHEIGSGPYFAYLWGEPLRRYCQLSGLGYQLATNLHADDPRQAYQQICVDNGVPEEDWQAFGIHVYLSLTGSLWSPRRRVERVFWQRDGELQCVYDASRSPQFPLAPLRELSDQEHFDRCVEFLRAGLDDGLETVEQTRQRFLQQFAS